MSLRIELIGTPGAGKSYAAAGQEEFRGEDVVSSLRGVRGRLVAFGRAPRFACYMFLAVVFQKRWRSENIRRLFNLQKRLIALIGAENGVTVVLDEGPLHGMFSALFGGIPTPLSVLFLRKAVRLAGAHLDHVVYIDTKYEVARSRFLRRDAPGSRFSNMSSAETASSLEEDRVYPTLVATVRTELSNKLFTVNGSDEARVLIQQLLSTPPTKAP